MPLWRVSCLPARRGGSGGARTDHLRGRPLHDSCRGAHSSIHGVPSPWLLVLSRRGTYLGRKTERIGHRAAGHWWWWMLPRQGLRCRKRPPPADSVEAGKQYEGIEMEMMRADSESREVSCKGDETVCIARICEQVYVSHVHATFPRLMAVSRRDSRSVRSEVKARPLADWKSLSATFPRRPRTNRSARATRELSSPPQFSRMRDSRGAGVTPADSGLEHMRTSRPTGARLAARLGWHICTLIDKPSLHTSPLIHALSMHI